MNLDLKYCFKGNDSIQNIISAVSEVALELQIDTYLVGGFVRDLMLNRPNKDIDIVVVGDALLFADKVAEKLNVLPVVKYEKFGIAMLPMAEMELEFASARKEVYEKSSRNPEISFTDFDQDLKRRDFTINAMAISLNRDNYGEFIDHYNGMQDLKRKIIKTPCDPIDTFFDDPLRMMRAVRFAAQLNFEIEAETFKAIKSCADRMDIISKERIRDEFLKILATDTPSYGIDLLYDSTLLKVLFPELIALRGVHKVQGYSHKDVYRHTMTVVDNVAEVSDDIILRMAALYHDVGKPKTKRFVETIGWTYHGHEDLGARMFLQIGHKLRLSQKQIKRIEKLIKLHLRPIAVAGETVTDSAVRRLMVEAGDDVDSLMILCRADITSKNERRVKKYKKNFELVAQRMQEVDEKDKLRAFKSPVEGHEIMMIFSLKPGPKIGLIKKHIESAILDGKIENNYEEAREYVLKNKEKLIALYLAND